LYDLGDTPDRATETHTMTTPKKADEDVMVTVAKREWKKFCKGHPDLPQATSGVVVDDDTIILHRDPGGPGTIVAVYRIVGASKLLLLGW
jgi:hypothetical protein